MRIYKIMKGGPAKLVHMSPFSLFWSVQKSIISSDFYNVLQVVNILMTKTQLKIKCKRHGMKDILRRNLTKYSSVKNMGDKSHTYKTKQFEESWVYFIWLGQLRSITKWREVITHTNSYDDHLQSNRQMPPKTKTHFERVYLKKIVYWFLWITTMQLLALLGGTKFELL